MKTIREEAHILEDGTKLNICEFENGEQNWFLPLLGMSEENIKKANELLEEFKKKKEDSNENI